MRPLSNDLPKGQESPFIRIRVAPEMLHAIKKKQKQTGQTVSELVRHALEAYLKGNR